MHICIQVDIHLKITPEEVKKLPLEGNMIFYNLKKKYSMRAFDKMRYLVHEVFFHIQDDVKGLICFQSGLKAALSCSSAERQDRAFVVAAECDS